MSVSAHLWSTIKRLWEDGAARVDTVDGATSPMHLYHPDAPRLPLLIDFESKVVSADAAGRIASAIARAILDSGKEPALVVGCGRLPPLVARIQDLPHLAVTSGAVDGERFVSFKENESPEKGKQVAVVAGLCGEGETLAAVASLVESTGAEPLIFLFLDRGMGGAERVAKRHRSLSTVISYNEFVTASRETGKISLAQTEHCLSYPNRLADYKAKRHLY